MLLETRELEMLVCCARTEMDGEHARRLRELLERGLDWEGVTLAAERHRVVPLVYRHLARLAPEFLQRPELEKLLARARRIAGRNLELTQELIRLLDLLGKNGIPAIPIKGPLLAVTAFGNLAARQFEDLDILVAPADIHRAMNVVGADGYEPEREMTRAQRAAFLRTEHAFQYRREGGRFVVELHWRLQDRYLSFPFEDRELWETAAGTVLFGRPVRSLSTCNLLLFLCMHGVKHYWERLEWIACLPAVIRRQPDLDWPALIQQARRMGGERVLHLGLLLAHDLDAGPSSGAALGLMKPDPIARELATRVWQKLGAGELAGSRREVYRFRFYLNARERFGDRVRVVRFASIRIPHPNSSQWERSRIPTWLLFLYYFVSPIRLLRKFGLQGLRGVFRPTEIL